MTVQGLHDLTNIIVEQTISNRLYISPTCCTVHSTLKANTHEINITGGGGKKKITALLCNWAHLSGWCLFHWDITGCGVCHKIEGESQRLPRGPWASLMGSIKSLYEVNLSQIALLLWVITQSNLIHCYHSEWLTLLGISLPPVSITNEHLLILIKIIEKKMLQNLPDNDHTVVFFSIKVIQ